MTAFSFIVNPSAGRGRGKRVAALLRSRLDGTGLNHTFSYTQGRGEARELARAAEGDVVVSVGGDGTVNEVVNGLMGSKRELGIIPAGSGNDLIKSLGIPSDPIRALGVLQQGGPREIDVGRIVVFGPEQGNSVERYFVNGVGIGFDAEVAERTTRIPFLSGTLLYLIAVLQTLGRYKAPTFSIAIDEVRTEASKLLIAIGNGRCAGGGFYLTPRAEVDDGRLDVCMIDAITITGILKIMPFVMRGRHLNLKGVSSSRGRRITVSSSAPFFVHADGEIVGKGANKVGVDVLPKAISVRCNKHEK